MVKTFANVIVLILFSTYLSIVVAQQPPKKLPLTLGKSILQMQNASTYTYFSSTFSTTKKFLAITANPSDDVFLSQFLSIDDSSSNQAYTQYPNSTNYTHKCSHIDLSTCIFDLSDPSGQLNNRSVTLYLSVYAAKDITYTLNLQLVGEKVLDTTASIELDFTKSLSAVLKISNQYQDPSIMFTYNIIAGSFDAIAEYDAIPHSPTSQGAIFTTIPYGPLRKVIKIQPVSNATWIYVLVSSQKSSIINVKLTQDPLELTVNSSISDISSQNSNYTAQISNSISGLAQLGTLYIHLGAFSGYGSVQLYYCEGIDWKICQLNGTTYQIVLSPQLRAMCQSEQAQTLTISTFEPINFGYDISLDESYTDFPLLINQQVMSYAINKSHKVYPLQLPAETYTYSVQYLQSPYQNSTELANQTQMLVFQVKQCQTIKNIKNKEKTCIVVGNGQNLQGLINFTSRLGYTYEIHVSDAPEDQSFIYYELSLGYNQVNNSNLMQNKQYLQEIALREYKYYWINLTSWKAKNGIIDYAQLNITVQTLNGNVDLLSSSTIPNPTIDNYIKNSSQIRLLFTDSLSEIIDGSVQIIYLSVYGQSASLFNLEYTLNANIDTPLRYPKMEDDVINQITLNKSKPYALISYQSHIKPYTITVDGNPKCIQYGYSLPLSETCFKKLPQLLYEKTVYLNISNGKPTTTNFNFNVTASSGSNHLTVLNSIMLSCNQACYSIINVALRMDSRVVIKGNGDIRSVQNSTNKNVKQILTLSCQKYPCSEKINASLPFRGSMVIYLMESSINYMSNSLLPFKMKQLPKNVIIPIKSDTDFSDLMLRSDGMSMDLVYHMLYLDTSNHNILNINFTQLAQNTQAYYQTVPLRNMISLPIGDPNLGKPNCSNPSVYCVAAVTFIPDFTKPYSYKFVSNGEALLSFNQGQRIQLALNKPVLLNSSMEMYHFELENSSSLRDSYRITVESLSSCHPTIQNNQNENIYGALALYKPDFPINFQTVTQDNCLYYVIITDSAYKTIISDKQYRLKTESGDGIFILTSLDGQISHFVLHVQGENEYDIDYILVKQLDSSKQFTIPTISSSSFKAANSTQLLVSSQSHSAYVIRVITKSPTIRLNAQQAEYIILSPNVQSKYAISSMASQQFVLYSKKAIRLNVQNLTGTLSINIHSYGKSSQTIVNNVSINGSKIIEINQDSDDQYITSYQVIVTNTRQERQSIALSFKEDIRYLRNIYERIVTYDAFNQVQQNNCYNYRAPLEVGREKIVLDFVLDYQKYTNCSCIDLLHNVSLKGMPAEKTQQDLNISFIKLQSSVHAYRLQAKFLADQEYTFCFSTPNHSAINKQYYILINGPLLQHLIAGKEAIKYSHNQLDNYQIVQQSNNQNVMMELTICNPEDDNDKTLVASTSELADFSALEDVYSNSDSTYASISADLGYYFIGVASKSASTGPYSLKYSTIGKDTQLLSSFWSLQSEDIVSVKVKDDGKVVIKLPQLVNSDKSGNQRNISLTYTVYFINMSDPQAASSVNSTAFAIQARCPNYHPNKATPPFAKQEIRSPIMVNKSITYTYSDLKQLQNSQAQVELKFEQSELPQKFNISGRADVKVNSQAFSYYYSNNYMDVYEAAKRHQGVGEYIVGAVIAILVFLIAGGVYAFMKYRRWKNRQKVDFELANFGQNSAVVQKNQGLITSPKRESTKGYYQMNEQIGEK